MKYLITALMFISTSVLASSMTVYSNAPNVRSTQPKMNVRMQKTPSGQVLKILAINMNDETVMEDGDNRFRDRRIAKTIQWIYENKPDIVLAQEIPNYRGFPSILIPIAAATGYDYGYNIGMGIPGLFNDGNGFLVKKELALSGTRAILLPGGSAHIGNGQTGMLSLGANSWAVTGRVTLQDGSPLYIYSTHLITGNDAQHGEDAIAINTDAVQNAVKNGEDFKQTRILIGGDFNSNPRAPAPVEMRALGYQDTFAEAHPELGDLDPLACTSCDNPTSVFYNPMVLAAGQFPKQVSPGEDDRIDYIMARGPQIRTLASTNLFTAPLDNGVWMSDHSGVFSTIAVGTVENISPVPNPIRDSEIPTTASLNIHLTKDNLKCTSISNCVHTIPDQSVSAARGITFFNDMKTAVRINVQGNGNIWGITHTILANGEVSTFYFDPGKKYSFTAHLMGTRRKLEGNVVSDLQ